MGDDIDKFGGDRFDVVSWDPRGTNTLVRCFTSTRSEDRFWAGEAVPTTPAAEARYSARPPTGSPLRHGQRLAAVAPARTRRVRSARDGGSRGRCRVCDAPRPP